MPLEWFPRLKQGNCDERKNWRLIGFGEGIHWEDLDEDISVEDLLAGKPSAESENSFKKWLPNRADRAETFFPTQTLYFYFSVDPSDY